MRRIVHLSDIHFGALDHAVLEPLRHAVWDAAPHLVVCSGDLTMDARKSEFREAKRFLESLPRPQLVVPGNHDMPYFNPLRRVLVRLKNYKDAFGDDLEPFHMDDEIAVAGVNTARLRKVRGGSINALQVNSLLKRLEPLRGSHFRIVVTHHPFDLPEEYSSRELVRRAKSSLERMKCSVDLLLAGHMHISRAAPIALRYQELESQAIFVQAGTASSVRERGEPNSFNLIEILRPDIRIRKVFLSADRQDYERAEAVHFRVTQAGRDSDEHQR